MVLVVPYAFDTGNPGVGSGLYMFITVGCYVMCRCVLLCKYVRMCLVYKDLGMYV